MATYVDKKTQAAVVELINRFWKQKELAEKLGIAQQTVCKKMKMGFTKTECASIIHWSKGLCVILSTMLDGLEMALEHAGDAGD